MTDLETMQRAKMYIDKLAQGINPLDDSAIPEGDIINNVRLSRCLFYVSDVLRQVIDNGGVTPPNRKKKQNYLNNAQNNYSNLIQKNLGLMKILK